MAGMNSAPKNNPRWTPHNLLLAKVYFPIFSSRSSGHPDFDWLPRSFPADLGWNNFLGVSIPLDEHISEESYW